MAKKYDTSYYDKAIRDYTKNAQSNANAEKAAIDRNTQTQLRQAYLNKMMSQRNINNNLAQQGIRGGVSETALLGNNQNYMASRNSINADAQQNKMQIDRDTANNIFDYTQSTNSARQQYLENRQAEDRQRANQLADEERQRDQEIRTQQLTAYYGKIYSIPDLKKALGKAKTPEEKAIINARIGYLRQHKKGY